MISFYPHLSFDQWSAEFVRTQQFSRRESDVEASLLDHVDIRSSRQLKLESLHALWNKLKSPSCLKSDISVAQQVMRKLALPCASVEVTSSDSAASQNELSETANDRSQAWESIKQAIFFGSHAVMILSQVSKVTKKSILEEPIEVEIGSSNVPHIQPFLQECLHHVACCCFWIMHTKHLLQEADRDLRAVLKVITV
jgi:hypothetical protein